MSARFTEDEAEAIDAVRGSVERGPWLRILALAALAAAKRQQPPAGRAATKDGCPHPKARVIKGFCHACGKPVIQS